MALVIDYRNEKRIMKVVNDDTLTTQRKISKLNVMALRAYPSSPIQKAIQEARSDLRTAN